MFNNFYGGKTSQSVEINAVTGAILKNHSKSWFERFHLKSERAKELLKEAGHKAKNLFRQVGMRGIVFPKMTQGITS